MKHYIMKKWSGEEEGSGGSGTMVSAFAPQLQDYGFESTHHQYRQIEMKENEEILGKI